MSIYNTLQQHRKRVIAGIAGLTILLVGAHASANGLRVQAETPVSGSVQAVRFSIANEGPGNLSSIRALGGTAIQCAPTTEQGRAFGLPGALLAGDRVACGMQSTGGGHLSIAVSARTTLGTPVVRTTRFDLRGALTPAQGALVLSAGSIHDDSDADGLLDAGESIDYHYTVVNVGTLDVSTLVLTDIDGDVTCPQTTLAVGAHMLCQRDHEITPDEDAAGEVLNIVDIVGTDADGGEVQAGDFVITLDLDADAGISVFKSPLLLDDADASGYAGVGDRLRYTFVAKNTNAQALSAVNLVEPDPTLIDTPITCAALTLAGAPFSGLGTGTLASLDTLLCTAEYTIQADDAANGEAINLVEASGQPTIGAPVFGSGASTVTIPLPASVTLSKALTGESGSQPGIAEPGETLTYTITLTNAGGADASDVGVTDVLDPNVVFVSADNGGAHAAGVVTWTGLTVPAAGDLVLTVTVTVADPVPDGVTSIANLAHETGVTPPDCPPAGDHCVITPTPGAVLVEKAVADANANGLAEPGEQLTYTVTLSNNGGSAVNGFDLTDVLDSNTSFVSADNGGVHAGGVITWTGLTVPAAGNLVLTIVVNVIDPLPVGVMTILNLAHETGVSPPDCAADPQPANCAEIPVAAEPQIAVVKTVDSASASPGGTVEYTITVANTGNVVVENMQVQDSLPTGIVAFAWSCTASGGAACANTSGNGAINETIASFPPGGELTYVVVATLAANPPASIVNIVTVTPDDIVTCIPDDTQSPCSADVSVTVVGEPPEPPSPPQPVPLDSPWMLVLMASLMLMLSGRRLLPR